MGKESVTIALDPSSAFKRRIRVRKEDSAFVYAILEAHEGVVSYSTLAHVNGDPHRDLELQVPARLASEADRILKELGELVYDLDS